MSMHSWLRWLNRRFKPSAAPTRQWQRRRGPTSFVPTLECLESRLVPAVLPPTMIKSFGPTAIPVGGTTTLTITITNPNASTTLTGIGFTDTLPAGLAFASPSNLTSTVGGVTTAATGPPATLSLSGGTLAGSASGTITVSVTGITAGVDNNVTGAVTSNEGGTGNTAAATLIVAVPPTISKTFGAAVIVQGGTTSLTFTFANPSGNPTLHGLSFTDTLPAGLVVATPNGLSGSVGGGTITAPAGSSSISLSGATLAGGSSGTFSVNVTGVVPGMDVNTTSTLSDTEGISGSPASASITIFRGTIITGTDAGGGSHVRVFDAITGAPKFDFYAYSPSQSGGGVRVAEGDANGDGVPDFLTVPGPGATAEVKAFDGLTGAPLRDFFAFGSTVTTGFFIAAGDLKKTGFANIVIGTDAGVSAEVRVFNGNTGAPVYDFFPYGMFPGGVRVGIGDVDGDTFPDIVTGTGPGGNALIDAFSGPTAGLIRAFYANPASFTLGVFVAAGDVNGDGTADFIIGANSGSSAVQVYDGKTGIALRAFYAYPGFAGGARVGWSTTTGLSPGAILTAPGPSPRDALPLGPLVQVLDRTALANLESYFAFASDFTSGVFVGG